LVAGYLFVTAPWFWHSWRVTGQPLTTAGTSTIFLTTYNDVFAYGRALDLEQYLAWGWENIIISKVQGLWLGLQSYIAVTGLTAFSFFVVVGWFSARRRPTIARFLRPLTLYAVLLLLVMSLVFTFPGQRGSLFHSSAALWPWSMALIPVGIERTVDWIARRRSTWRPRQAKRIFSVLFVVMAYLLTFAVAANDLEVETAAAVYQQVAATVPGNAVLMTSDPPGVYYHTGLPAVVAPNEPPAVMLEAADRYGANYLLLDQGHPPPLSALYEGQVTHPRVRLARDFGEGYRLYQLLPAEEAPDD
jgi:hypothetical protein